MDVAIQFSHFTFLRQSLTHLFGLPVLGRLFLLCMGGVLCFSARYTHSLVHHFGDIHSLLRHFSVRMTTLASLCDAHIFTHSF
jgi:hypothetical protein